MSAVQNRGQLFGLDLASFGRDLVVAWRGMLNWPLLVWLWPKQSVRLLMPEGVVAFCRGPDVAPVCDEKHIRMALAAKYEAVVLPEQQLLRSNLVVPALAAQDLQAALALQVQTLNPFTTDDLVWAYQSTSQSDHATLVDLVLSSRKHIAQHLSLVQTQLKTPGPEIWTTTTDGRSFIVLCGFGESRRQRLEAIWRWISAMLVLLALLLLAALAVTPSVQQYMRFRQASRAMSDLQQKAMPVLQQRESLVRATDQLAALAKLVGEPVPPLRTLSLITQALPDDTSLLSIQIQGNKVNISGQTTNAAALMKQLGSTPGLHAVTAPTPATKPLGASRESFSIEFMLDVAPSKAEAAP